MARSKIATKWIKDFEEAKSANDDVRCCMLLDKAYNLKTLKYKKEICEYLNHDEKCVDDMDCYVVLNECWCEHQKSHIEKYEDIKSRISNYFEIAYFNMITGDGAVFYDEAKFEKSVKILRVLGARIRGMNSFKIYFKVVIQ